MPSCSGPQRKAQKPRRHGPIRACTPFSARFGQYIWLIYGAQELQQDAHVGSALPGKTRQRRPSSQSGARSQMPCAWNCAQPGVTAGRSRLEVSNVNQREKSRVQCDAAVDLDLRERTWPDNIPGFCGVGSCHHPLDLQLGGIPCPLARPRHHSIPLGGTHVARPHRCRAPRRYRPADPAIAIQKQSTR
jgi:hypothetical protein